MKLSRRTIADDAPTHENETLDIQLEEFDEHADPSFEETRRGMIRYRNTEPETQRWRRDQMEVNERQAAQIKDLQRAVAKLIKASNIKASKGELAQLKADLQEESSKRMDTIRNWLIAAITGGGFIVTLFRALK